MSLESALYVGQVRHRRREPAHEFTLPVVMAYLDLAEIDRALALSPLMGRDWWRPVRYRREDYLVRDGLDLDASVRRCVEQATGRRPSGPIRMLTHLRLFGYLFNPVTFYYCFDEGDVPSAVVAEITNTPWKERHAYVLDAASSANAVPRTLRRRFPKEFHVSPFLPMELEYDWTFTAPSDSLLVHMNLRRLEGARDRSFDATLELDRRELTPRELQRALLRYPLMTVQVTAMIHVQALRLWLKGAPVHTHPGRRPVPTPTKGARDVDDVQTSQRPHG